MALDILPGESRGYWKYHVPDKKFKQAKATGRINNEKANLLFDSGAEVSIVDTTFARKVGCYIDESQTLECEGIGKSPYLADGRTRLKITLAGSLVYFFDVWVGPPTGGQDLILGMDFMVPAGIRLDLADGSISLPDEVRIQMTGLRPLYGESVEHVTLNEYQSAPVGGSIELRKGFVLSSHRKLWITPGDRWVPSVVAGPGKTRYLQLTNVSDRELVLHRGTRVGMWLSGDRVPRLPGFVSVGSRRYTEWQNLAYQATTDQQDATQEAEKGGVEDAVPAVERPQYKTLTAILKRAPPVVAELDAPTVRNDVDYATMSPSPGDRDTSVGEMCGNHSSIDYATSGTASGDCDTTVEETDEDHSSDDYATPEPSSNDGDTSVEETGADQIMCPDANSEKIPTMSPLVSAETRNISDRDQAESKQWTTHNYAKEEQSLSDCERPAHSDYRRSDGDDLAEDDQVCLKESGELFAEDVEQHLVVLPEVAATTDEVKIEDIQVGDPEAREEQIDRLRQTIWKCAHLLIGKGNALPPAARGAICDIDVGNAKPVAQRVRKVAPQFREKLFQLIKGLLSAKMIQLSTSPWASPIVVIIKKNGVDIRLCIDYRLINSLTRLMVYPMPLINDLLDDLDKVLWYCSLDMASGFWVVSMTDRARAISAFITPFGLFEWNRMPFGLKNAPQIYQRSIDNVLYGFLRIPDNQQANRADPPADRSDAREDRSMENKLEESVRTADCTATTLDVNTRGLDRDGTGADRIDLFKVGEPDLDMNESVLGRRSYIDDILVTSDSWDNLCDKVDKLLDACDQWNLSISVAKSVWGRRKVDYLSHRVSNNGLETNPKDLDALANLPFPKTLRAMQSFLGSLNYYCRFIEDFAIYAAVLYELREADFYEMSRK